MEDRSNNLRHENIHNLAQHKHKTWFSAKFQLLGCGINPSICTSSSHDGQPPAAFSAEYKYILGFINYIYY